MNGTTEYKNGVYTGELEDGVPHGKGILEIDENTSFEGCWRHGLRHGVGHFRRISRHEFDGLDTVYIHHRRGVWTDDVLSGAVWEYTYEEDMSERLSEICVFRDTYGLDLFGINREFRFTGVLGQTLSELDPFRGQRMLCYEGNRSWGKVIRDGHTLIGQFSSESDRPYYAEDFVPHGFCIDMMDGQLVWCGTYRMGERCGVGVSPAADGDFKMEFQVI